MDLSVKVGRNTFAHPLMNAGGTCKTISDVKKFVRSPVAAIEWGSITAQASHGNIGTTYHEVCQDGALICTLNSLGMPNPGKLHVMSFADEACARAHENDKKIGVNIAGNSPQEFTRLAEAFARYAFDFLVLNTACPNIWKKGMQEGLICFHPEILEDLLVSLEVSLGQNPPFDLWLKLSPILDQKLLSEVIHLCKLSDNLTACVLTNTLPNAYAHEGAQDAITTNELGLGGMGGPALKPIALGQIRQFRAYHENTAFHKRLAYIGTGGVTGGTDVLLYRQKGASLIGAASAYFTAGENVRVYERILHEYVDVLEAHSPAP